MKIVVILNKYGEQINLSLPNHWVKKDVFENSEFGEVTQKFIDYFEKQTDKFTNDSQLYFDHVFFVDISQDLINYQPHHYDEFDEWTDYPYLGIGKKPHKNKYPTEMQLENIIGG
jgi:hypothetical protein